MFLHALHETLGGSDLVFTLRLREPLDLGRVLRCYERQVRARPGLRLKYLPDTAHRRFGWRPFSDAELEAQLAGERVALGEFAKDAVLPAEPPPNTRLPYRLALLDRSTLVARVSHVLVNATAGMFWLEDFLHFYALDDDTVPPLPESPQPRAPWLRRLGRGLSGTFWSCVHLAALRWRAGRDVAADTLDLAPGDWPENGRLSRFSISRAILSPEQTQRLRAASRERGWSVTAQLLEAFADQLFETHAEGRRLLIVLPAERRRELPHASFAEPGNSTASITVQLLRAQALEPQVRAVMRALRRGVAHWTATSLDRFVRDELSLAPKLAADLRRPIAERGVFESLSCVFSNVGQHREFARLDQLAEWMTYEGRASVPLFCVATVGGSLSIQLTTPDELSDSEALHELLGETLTRLGVPTDIQRR